MNKLTTYTIKEIQRCYREKLFTPNSFIDSSLQNARATADLNAFVTITSEEAAKHAFESEQRFSAQLTPRELEGITVAVKDNFCTKNITTTCASRMLESFVPTYDATVYRKLREAGACLIGKTNLDEFAMGSGTVNSIHGPTKNVWGNKDRRWRIAGGSSGGSAVAVASGAAVAAIGSDTGGSTRNPAALCGLVGLKPTYGSVSRHGLIPLVNSMDVPGILTRKVEDCVSIFNVISGPDDLDSTTMKKKLKAVSLTNFDLRKIRIGIPGEYLCNGMNSEVVDTWRYIENKLKLEGASTEPVTMPYTSISIAVYSILNQCEVASNMSRYDGLEYGLRSIETHSTEEMYASSRSQGFSDVVRGRIFAGNYFLLGKNYDKYFTKALKLRRLICNDFNKVFSSGINILLTPTTLTEAPLYEDFISKDNRDQCALQDYCTQPANMAGVPALTIPVRLSKSGLPLSIQLTGPHFSEELLLNVAKKIEDMVNFPVNSGN